MEPFGVGGVLLMKVKTSSCAEIGFNICDPLCLRYEVCVALPGLI